MQSLADIVLTGENFRTIVLPVVIAGGFLLQNAKVDKQFAEVKAHLSSRIDSLKSNGFAHLDSAFRNLTFVLEKRRLIGSEDKAFIDNALDA